MLSLCHFTQQSAQSKLGLPEQVEITLHDTRQVDSLVRVVIRNGVVLEPIGAHLVSSHPRTHLILSLLRKSRIVLGRNPPEHTLFNGRPCFLLAVDAASALSGSYDTSWFVEDAAGVLMLVAVLPACTSTRVPRDIQITVAKFYALNCRINYGYSDCTRVNSSLTLCWRNALDSMATTFILKHRQIVSFDFEMRLSI